MARRRRALAHAVFETSNGVNLVGSYPTRAAAEAHIERVRRQYGDEAVFEVVGVPIPDARGPFGREG